MQDIFSEKYTLCLFSIPIINRNGRCVKEGCVYFLFFGLHLGNKVVSSKQTHLLHTSTRAPTHTVRCSRGLRPPPGSGGRSVQHAGVFCRFGDRVSHPPAASSVWGLNQSLWEKKKRQQHLHVCFCRFGEFKTWKSYT